MSFNQVSRLLGYNNSSWNAGLARYARRHLSAGPRHVDSDAENRGGGYAHGYFSPRGLEQYYPFSLSVGFLIGKFFARRLIP